MIGQREPPVARLDVTSYLVTGGSGAFGTAFVRSVLTDPRTSRVCVFSRSESRQAQLKHTVTDGRVRWFIGDVRDRDRLYRAMQSVQVVVHAAALKRIEVCEYDASECMETNIVGTDNVIHAATTAGVTKVVTLSSDKGSAPVGMYGASKLAAERLTLAAEEARGATGPHFAATRYGNVAGSTGSVIPVWRGPGPHTLSDPDVTRFWMTLTEAVDLVRWTIVHMRGGELMVPPLPAYRLGDLAEAMGVSPVVTGGSSHEKQHETMLSDVEFGAFRRHGPYYSNLGSGEALAGPLSSATAPRLSVDELKQRLEGV